MHALRTVLKMSVALALLACIASPAFGGPAKAPRGKEERALNAFMFNDASFVFQCLWRFGVAATGGSDLGELLTIVSGVEDFDKESWYASWNAMAEHVAAQAAEYEAAGHGQSAREAYFRATTYYRASEIYLAEADPRKHPAWQKGRDTFLKAADLSGGRITHVRIPNGDVTMPGYFVTPDPASDAKRPLLIIHTGLDGTAEDLYFIMGVQAARRGYDCLIFEGPGQGEMISEHDVPFRHDWEAAVTPVVDFALTQDSVDPERIALLGYSMGGYLGPRALAHEKRIRWGIADGGVYSVFEGTMTKFPAQVKEAVLAGQCDAKVDAVARERMRIHPDLSQFINQMFWTFQAETPCDLFKKLQRYDISSVIGDIGDNGAEMLVVNSIHDQIAGSYAQAKQFYEALPGKKTYMEFSDAQGAQFHCQSGAPMVSSARILNWLDERAKPMVEK